MKINSQSYGGELGCDVTQFEVDIYIQESLLELLCGVLWEEGSVYQLRFGDPRPLRRWRVRHQGIKCREVNVLPRVVFL